MFASLLSKLFPEVLSTCIFRYHHETRQLINEAELSIRFSLPFWFPLEGGIIERKGSEVIKNDLERDLQTTFDRIMTNYQQSVHQRLSPLLYSTR